MPFFVTLPRRFVVPLLAASVIVAGCGDDPAVLGTEEGKSSVSVSTGVDQVVAPTTATTTAATATTAAISTTTAASPSGDLPDPCSLLTAADIESATGLSFDEGVINSVMSSADFAACDWISNGGEYATAQVLIGDGSAGEYESQKTSAAGVFSLIDVEVPGADSAYATDEGSLIGMSVNGFFLQVAYLPPGPGTVLVETTQIATEVVSNL